MDPTQITALRSSIDIMRHHSLARKGEPRLYSDPEVITTAIDAVTDALPALLTTAEAHEAVVAERDRLRATNVELHSISRGLDTQLMEAELELSQSHRVTEQLRAELTSVREALAEKTAEWARYQHVWDERNDLRQRLERATGLLSAMRGSSSWGAGQFEHASLCAAVDAFLSDSQPPAVVPADVSEVPQWIPCSDRCGACGWGLVADHKHGCVRGNCSQRPIPERMYDGVRYAAEQQAQTEVKP